MEGSDGEGILSGRQSRKEGRVSLLFIWEFLGGRGFVEGGGGEGVFSGHQFTREGGVSLLCIWKFLGGRGFVEGSEDEGNFSGHQFTREGGVSLPCTRKFLGRGEMWEGRGMSFLSCTFILLLDNGCVGGFVSFCDICVGFSFNYAPILAVVLAFICMYD